MQIARPVSPIGMIRAQATPCNQLQSAYNATNTSNRFVRGYQARSSAAINMIATANRKIPSDRIIR